MHIDVDYNGYRISYESNTDERWHISMDGQIRKFKTIEKAMEAIDKIDIFKKMIGKTVYTIYDDEIEKHVITDTSFDSDDSIMRLLNERMEVIRITFPSCYEDQLPLLEELSRIRKEISNDYDKCGDISNKLSNPIYKLYD